MDKLREASRTTHTELARINNTLAELVDTKVFGICIHDIINPNEPTTLNQKLEQLAAELEIPLQRNEEHVDPIAKCTLLEVFYGFNLAFYQHIRNKVRYDDFNINPLMVNLSIARYQAELLGAVNNSMLQIRRETRKRNRLGGFEDYASANERYEQYWEQIEKYPYLVKADKPIIIQKK